MFHCTPDKNLFIFKHFTINVHFQERHQQLWIKQSKTTHHQYQRRNK